MMRVFQKAAVTAMKVAGDITKPAVYLGTSDDGFGNVEKLEKPCRIIYDKFTDEELAQYGWQSLIQVKDKKGLVPTLSIAVPIKAQKKIRGHDGTVYTIVAKEIDAADALYILLLRKV